MSGRRGEGAGKGGCRHPRPASPGLPRRAPGAARPALSRRRSRRGQRAVCQVASAPGGTAGGSPRVCLPRCIPHPPSSVRPERQRPGSVWAVGAGADPCGARPSPKRLRREAEGRPGRRQGKEPGERPCQHFGRHRSRFMALEAVGRHSPLARRGLRQRCAAKAGALRSPAPVHQVHDSGKPATAPFFCVPGCGA